MQNGSNSDEVRDFGFRNPRARANFQFCLQLNSTKEMLWAVCTDISEQGLAADLLRGLAVGSEVTLMLDLPGSRVPVPIQAVVNHQQDDRRHGFTFVYSSEEERALVQAFLRSIAPQALGLSNETPS